MERECRLARSAGVERSLHHPRECAVNRAPALARHLFDQRRANLVMRERVVVVLLIPKNPTVLLAPGPISREESLDRRRLAREGDVVGRHLRRHDADEIVGTDQPIERRDERLADVVRAVDADVIRVEKDDEETRARRFHHRAGLSDGIRLDTHFLEGLARQPGAPPGKPPGR